MPNKKHHIDNLFHSGLKGHKIPTPENSWARLQHDLQKPPRSAFFYYSRAVAAMVLLLLAFGAGYFLSEMNREDSTQIAGQTQPLPPEVNTEPLTLQDYSKTAGISDNIVLESSNIQTSKTKTAAISEEAVSQELTLELPSQQNNKLIEINEIDDPAVIEVFKDEIAKAARTEEENTGANSILKTDIIDPEEELSGEGETTKSPEMMTPEMLHRLLSGPENDLLFADLELSKASEDSPWIIGGRISPVYSYRSLGGDFYTTPDEKVDASFFDQNEEGITTIAGGISLDYQFNSRLSLGSGLFISRIGQQNNNVLAYNDPDFSNMYKLASSTGSVSINPAKFENAIQQPIAIAKDSLPGDYIINGRFVQNLDYLEIPFVLKYKVIESKLSLQLMGGLSPGILVNNRSYFQLDGEKLQTGTTENIDPFIYNSIVGFGLSYALSEKLSFNMEPSFKYALSPVNNTAGINYHPYSFSWFTGISYRIY